MVRVYVCPFQSNVKYSNRSTDSLNLWPYDSGDDPSFYSSKQHEGKLTWGVCRQDVRNNIEKNDIVVFFSFHKYNQKTEYRFCSIATVEMKISQDQIWKKKEFSVFRNYKNLLIRPSKKDGVWDHYEPAYKLKGSHKDWLWRCIKHKGLKKEQFNHIHKENLFTQGSCIAGISLEFAPNYVIFSENPKDTLVISAPQVIAQYSGGIHETWLKDKFSRGIQKLILGKANSMNQKKRWLRINNIQRPHRHLKFDLSKKETDNWRKTLFDFIENL